MARTRVRCACDELLPWAREATEAEAPEFPLDAVPKATTVYSSTVVVHSQQESSAVSSFHKYLSLVNDKTKSRSTETAGVRFWTIRVLKKLEFQ